MKTRSMVCGGIIVSLMGVIGCGQSVPRGSLDPVAVSESARATSSCGGTLRYVIAIADSSTGEPKYTYDDGSLSFASWAGLGLLPGSVGALSVAATTDDYTEAGCSPSGQGRPYIFAAANDANKKIYWKRRELSGSWTGSWQEVGDSSSRGDGELEVGFGVNSSKYIYVFLNTPGGITMSYNYMNISNSTWSTFSSIGFSGQNPGNTVRGLGVGSGASFSNFFITATIGAGHNELEVLSPSVNSNGTLTSSQAWCKISGPASGDIAGTPGIAGYHIDQVNTVTAQAAVRRSTSGSSDNLAFHSDISNACANGSWATSGTAPAIDASHKRVAAAAKAQCGTGTNSFALSVYAKDSDGTLMHFNQHKDNSCLNPDWGSPGALSPGATVGAGPAITIAAW